MAAASAGCTALSGIRFGDSDDGYYSEQTDNSQYFNQLPEASARIMLASCMAGSLGLRSPMAGINADDWYMAAQCIIGQQLRSDATSRHDNGGVAENTFFRIVQGRPARTGLLLDSGADRFPFYHSFFCRCYCGKRPGA